MALNTNGEAGVGESTTRTVLSNLSKAKNGSLAHLLVEERSLMSYH
jgi:hypothetical protein